MRRLMSLDMLVAVVVAALALTVVFTGSTSDMLAALALLAVTCALVAPTRYDPRGERIEALLARIADAVAPVESLAMVKPGNWYVDLDDGSGADRHAEVDGAAKLEVGAIIPKAEGGRDYRVVRVDGDSMHAYAVPHE